MASAYFVAIPIKPDSHIQTMAPGPPRTTAVATPTMFPVPTVAASAVMSAWKWVMSPRCFFCSAFAFGMNASLKPNPSRVTWMKPSRMVKKIPVPINKISKCGPQTRSDNAVNQFSNCVICPFPLRRTVALPIFQKIHIHVKFVLAQNPLPPV